MTQMRNNSLIKKIAGVLSCILLWLVIWEIATNEVGLDIFFPGPVSTFRALGALIITSEFWKTIIYSIGRIMLGLTLGASFGILLALLSRLHSFIHIFISIGMTVIKSTPVASIVMILWIIIDSSHLPVVIGLLMVMPIIWQNLIDAFNSVDKKLLEMAEIFEFSRFKTIRYIWFPTLVKFLIPAIITSIGLAWKSGIAAEIISYAKNSIGKNIYLAKAFFESESLMAWTLTVVILSLIFEFSAKLLLRRFNNAAD